MANWIINPKAKVENQRRFSVVVLAANYYKSKNNGSKLLTGNTHQKFILRQLEQLERVSDDIVYVLGYDAEKIHDFTCKHTTVINELYETCNSLKNTILGLRATKYSDVIIIDGDHIYHSDYFKIDNTNWIGTYDDLEDICVTSTDNIVQNFSYGLTKGWSKITYLTPECAEYIRNMKINSRSSVMFDYEIYNKMIDKGHIFKDKRVECE